MADKIYVGNGKSRTTEYGDKMGLSFSKADLEVMMNNLNEKGYINLNLNERKETWKYGETHYMTIYDGKPEQKAEGSVLNTIRVREEQINIWDIPF